MSINDKFVLQETNIYPLITAKIGTPIKLKLQRHSVTAKVIKKPFDVVVSTEKVTFQDFNTYSDVLFTPDNKFILLWTNRGNNIDVFDINGNYVTAIKSNQHLLISVSLDSRFIAVSQLDQKVAIWDLSWNKVLEINLDRAPIKANFSFDGNFLIITEELGNPIIYDIKGRKLAEYKNSRKYSERTAGEAKISENGEFIAIQTVNPQDEGIIRIYKFESLENLIANGCGWLGNYLNSFPEEKSKVPFCSQYWW